jgi:FMN phosphatase YigB (HAD superfamily)
MYSTKPKALILDMDGTLCDVSSVRHYVTGESKNFDAFHRASLFCPPNDWVKQIAVNIKGAQRIIVTGRMNRYRPTTSNWLAKHEVPFERLIMRPEGDQRPDYEVKEEILLDKILPYYDVILAVDDNPAVIQVWQEHDIPVVIVPGWDS